LKSEPVGNLQGRTFCITGTLTRPRKQVALLIKANGGKVVSSVSGNLNYLIAGDSAGSKLETAGNLGVTILSEEEFNRILKLESFSEEFPVDTQKSLMDF
jgi:DNA ligase (NAD+)